MAWRNRAQAAYGKTRTFVRNNYYAGSRGRGLNRRFYAGNRKGTMGLYISTPHMAGIAAAFAVPQNTDIDMAAVGVATAPVRGFGAAKQFAAGYAFGQVLQHWALPKLGIRIPDFGAGVIPGIGTGNTTGNNVVR